MPGSVLSQTVVVAKPQTPVKRRSRKRRQVARDVRSRQLTENALLPEVIQESRCGAVHGHLVRFRLISTDAREQCTLRMPAQTVP